MKPGIHPDYKAVNVHCACGATWESKSTTKGGELRLEICSSCHPFFTGKQRLVDSAGRIERFNRKFGEKVEGTKSPKLKAPAKPAAPPKPKKEAAPKKEKAAKKDAAATPAEPQA